MPPAPIDLYADCPHCLLEAGAVETYDPLVAACRFGLPSIVRCRLCDATAEGVVDPGRVAEPLRSIDKVPANACPVCLALLEPSALDLRRCDACGAQAWLKKTKRPTAFQSRDDVHRALTRWAEAEDFPTAEDLMQSMLVLETVEALFSALGAGKPIEAVADPFARGSYAGQGAGAAHSVRPPPGPGSRVVVAPSGQVPAAALADLEDGPTEAIDPAALRGPTGTASLPRIARLARQSARPAPASPTGSRPLAPPAAAPSFDRTRAELPPPQPERAPPSQAPPSAPPRSIVYPLLSVICADGEIHPEERAVVDRFLASEGLPPLAEEEFRVHNPQDVAKLVPPARREAVIQLMCETASVDGMPDASEIRVIRAYAAAWHVPDERVDFWLWGYENMNSPGSRQLWLRIRRFVLSARWEGPR